MRYSKPCILILCVFLLTVLPAVHAEEGMYPISDIRRLDLESMGLEIRIKDLYNPKGISLIDGICKVGGCTGSFVSEQGLILTNHHCAYRAIQRASTMEKDFLRDGFLAENRSEEIPAVGYTVRITESYRDVSEEILRAVSDGMDPVQRTKAVEKKMKQMVEQVEKEHPGKKAEVSEMFPGKTYVLFIYTSLKDVRLVYAPPRSIGNFGGEADNWMWPRHTGDFSFMRAYVAPDGSPAEYARKNIPYKPRHHLKVAPEGVNEEDFVFILGYPGRTYRHHTSDYLAYEEGVRMPLIVEMYEWLIALMEEMGRNDRAVALKHVSTIKSLANTMKNYKGKLQGLRRLGLVETRRKDEKKLLEYVASEPGLEEKYGDLLVEIAAVYEENREKAPRDLLLQYGLKKSVLCNTACTVYEAAVERRKKDLERESQYMNRNYARTKERLLLALNDFYEPTDRLVLEEMLLRAARLPADLRIPAVEARAGKDRREVDIDRFIEEAYASTKLWDKDWVAQLLEKTPEQIEKLDDPFLAFARDLYPTYRTQREEERRRKGILDVLYANLTDLKMAYLGRQFIPDANGTLRLTYGRIRGYRPRDAVSYSPVTTTLGVLEKSTGEEPFDTPKRLLDLIRSQDFGRYRHPTAGGVPVAILYNMDTTGGNSGSPVLNARGELVGVNFDRAFEATINDFAWSEDYSRSIAVDVRYVLWILSKYGKVDYLLEEMGIGD